MVARHSLVGKVCRALVKLRAPATIAAILTLVVILIGFEVDRRSILEFQSGLQDRTSRITGLVSSRIAMRIDADAAAADHILHTFATDAEGSIERFGGQVSTLLARMPHVAGIAVAPNFELAHIFLNPSSDHPAAGAGIDSGKIADQLKAVADRDRISLLGNPQAGYVTLVVPITDENSAFTKKGAIALLIDKAGLMTAAGLNIAGISPAPRGQVDLDWVNVAIRDADNAEKPLIFGDASVYDLEPQFWPLSVNGATWEVIAAPRSGWAVLPPDHSAFRLKIMISALAVIVPIIIVSLLLNERNRNIAVLKAREANLIELSKRFHLAMEASNIGIWEVTDENHHLFWDERAAMLHGKEPGGQKNRLDDWLASIFPEDRAAAEAHFFTCICTNAPCNESYRVELEDGTIRYLRSAGASYRDPDGSQRTTGIIVDITSDMMMTHALRSAKETSDIKNAELELALDELSNREQELEELSTKLDLALASSNCGIWESNPTTHIESWDARMCQLHGIPFTDGVITADRWISLLHPEDREAALKSSYHFTDEFRPDVLVARVPLPDGGIRYIRSIGKLHSGRDGTQKVIGIAFDVTDDAIMTEQLKAAKKEADAKNAELELAKSRIEHNALHDPLTQLANRRKLDMELDRLSRASYSRRQKFSLLHLDLDRFKQINDTLGHAAGDAMLVHASHILSRNVREGDLVARIGGDEFVILAMDNGSSEQMARLASRIIAELRQPVDFEGFSCRCGVSIGIAQAGGLNLDARKTLVNADIALYRAKAMGRNRYEFFTQNLQAEIINHKRTADEVLAGIDNSEFETWYQPQFDARTNRFTGVEALVRWNHPHHGILAPDRFLKIAEDLNVAATLDQIVLETVLKDQMRWAARGIEVPKVSVNVSSRRLHDESLIETLKSLHIPPGRISFELVESIFLDESEDAAQTNLDRIKALGIDIEIDDFGTGHTSIVSLLKLKPKRLKIDRQLVMPILNSPQERALVRSIIDIARSLGVETVAEGVETMQHAAMLRELGCDLLQGYAFSRPLSFGDFTQQVRTGWLRSAA